MNHRLAQRILEHLACIGVRTVCVCPGARAVPLISALQRSRGFEVLSFFEERQAGFFALGRIKRDGRPVAVVTTSGTAAAELLPPIIEAHYAQLPLIAVTADRPRSYRGSNAPQAIEQVGLFGIYAKCCDVEGDETPSKDVFSSHQPLHMNVCFDEPLLDGEAQQVCALETFPHKFSPIPSSSQLDALQHFIESHRNLLVMIGELPREVRAVVRAFALHLGAPLWAEPLSGLREDPALVPLRLRSEASLAEGTWDAVLRIGGVPTARFWRDLESSLRDLPVWSIVPAPYSGLARTGIHLQMLPGEWLSEMILSTREKANDLFEADDQRMQKIDFLLREHPLSEPALIAAISAKLSPSARIYLGNSLPIREWMQFANSGSRQWEYAANRGANGIDGQLATFLGWCVPDTENWAVLGDLTTLYDLSAPWVVPYLSNVHANIVVINNRGGQIFRRMFPGKALLNEHHLSFEHWAAMWKLPYHRWEYIPEDVPRTGLNVIELVPDDVQTQSFWKEMR